MTGARFKRLVCGLSLMVLVGIGFATAWFWQVNAYQKIIATNEAHRQADLAQIANAAASQTRQALARQQDAERQLAALDKTATAEKEKLNDENEALRRSVVDGTRRLRIAGSCRANGGDVPGTASAARLGDAGTVELSRATGQAVLDLRRDIIADQAALKAAQSYIKDVCLKTALP